MKMKVKRVEREIERSGERGGGKWFNEEERPEGWKIEDACFLFLLLLLLNYFFFEH